MDVRQHECSLRSGVLLLLLSSFASGQAPATGASSPALDIVLQETTGEVDYQLDRKSPWRAAEKGTRLGPGAIVSTAESSSATISFGTSSAAVVQELSLFTIVSFGLQGDTLAAQVKVDPGVVRVSVTQLPQYRTDFQVSTPRLTASVRGSEELVTSEGDEIEDSVVAVEHKSEVHEKSGAVREVREGGKTDSRNTAPHELALLHSLTAVEPHGVVRTERTNPELRVSTAASIELIGSDLEGHHTKRLHHHIHPRPAQEPPQPPR